MKRKVLSLLLTLALCLSLVPLTVLPAYAADSELTVGNGTATSLRIPTYGEYNYSKDQYIIPASELTSISGHTITALKWYLQEKASNPDRKLKVILSEVQDDTMTSLIDVSGEPVLFEGTPVWSSSYELLVTFDTPYNYNGGNLLVTVLDVTGRSVEVNIFYGVTRTDAACYTYGDSAPFNADFVNDPNDDGGVSSFMPKTTLFYGGAHTEYDLWVGGEQVTSANAGDLSVISGVSGKVKYDDATQTLTLENATLGGAGYPDWRSNNAVITIAKRDPGIKQLTIAFSGNNEIECEFNGTSGLPYYNGICGVYTDFIFDGDDDATLTISGRLSMDPTPENGALCCGSITLNGGTILCQAPEEECANPYDTNPYGVGMNNSSGITLTVNSGKLISKAFRPLVPDFTVSKLADNTILRASVNYDGTGLESYDFSSQKTYRYVEATPKNNYAVTIGPGKYMSLKSGTESQTVAAGDAISEVIYTADEGYYFPADYETTPVNGIGVTRNSFTQITVSGTPTANTTFYPADATAKTKPATPSVSATDCTTESNDDGTITGVDNTMEYQKSGDTAWTAITGSTVEGLAPGAYSVRIAETDTTLASDAASVSIAEYVVVPKVDAPAFTPASGTTFTETLDVTISIPDNATVYYTTDKSDPSETNGIMTTGAAITLDETTTLKAIAISTDANYENSDVVTATYTKTTPSTGGGGGGATTYPVTPAEAENGKITVSPKNAAEGDKVTIIVTPDEGYELDKLTVKDKDGNEIKAKDNGDGTFTIEMPASEIAVEVTFKEAEETPGSDDGFPFVDVPEDAYYRKPVEWAVENGITSGVSEDKYGPELSCTRAQVVTFLWITCGSEDAGTETGFDDVDVDAYYDKAVAWAVEKGITAGTSENEFSPEMTVTRAQFVTMLWVANGMHEVDGEMPFKDVPQDSYYAKAVAWAYANDITAGKSADSFAPDDPCTRGQIMTFLYNAYAE